jgi:DNA-binding MarR family transcriptional regulator
MTRSTRTAARDAAPPDRGDEASMRVLRQFRQIFNAVKTHFRQVESQAGLGGAQVWALGLIREHPGIGVSELARRMDVHQSTASNLVRALVEKELIATAKDDVDRRSVQLNTLPAGVRALRASPGPFEGVLPGALRSLDPELLRRLHADLSVLIRTLEAEGADPHTPLAEL